MLGSLLTKLLKVSTMANKLTTSVLCLDRSCLAAHNEGSEKFCCNNDKSTYLANKVTWPVRNFESK